MPGPWPSVYTPELAAAICENLELGMPLTLAAEAEGVHRTTAQSWEDRDQNGCASLFAQARARGAKMWMTQAREGGKGSNAATWMLERRYRDDYAPPKKEEVQPSEVRITIEGGLPRTPREPT
jgi:hypothetical protein